MHLGEPAWLEDRAALIGFRFRAAYYGYRLRLMRPFADLLGIAGLIIGMIGLLVLLRYDWIMGILFTSWPLRTLIQAGLLAVTTLLFWALVRYLGNIPRLMSIAAADADAAEQMRSDMTDGMKSPAAYSGLLRMYDTELVTANRRLAAEGYEGSFAPVVLRDAHGRVKSYCAVAMPCNNVELCDLLGQILEPAPWQPECAGRSEPRQDLLRTWRSKGSHARNARGNEEGQNYFLRRFRVVSRDGGAQLRLDVGVATYGEIVRSCDALVNEFALFGYISRTQQLSMRSSTMLKCLPWRRETLRRAGRSGDMFLEPHDRVAGLGVAVATTLTDSTDRIIVALGMRSRDVGTYPTCLHVIPAGMCNTHGSERSSTGPCQSIPAWYLETNMRSEFIEEWHDDEDLEQSRISNWRHHVDGRWQTLVGDEPITLTGVAFDLINLRPEICALVNITQWGEELCWEYVDAQAHSPYLLSSIGEIDNTEIVQAGAACLRLAQLRTEVLHGGAHHYE